MIEDQPSKIDLNVPQSRILAPDFLQDAEASSYIERRQPESGIAGGQPPFSLLGRILGEPLPAEDEESEPTPQYIVTLKEGYVVERSVDGDGIILHIVSVGLVPMDDDPRPTVTVPVGKAVFVRIQTDSDGLINESVALVVDEPDKASTHHVSGSVDGDYYIKVGEVPVAGDYKTYVQSDIDHYHEDTGGSYSLSNYDGETENAEDIGRVLYQENPNDPDDGGKSWVLRVIEGEERVTVDSEDGTIKIESANFSLENYTGGYDGDGQILEGESPNDPDDGGKVWKLRELVAGTGVTITNEGGTIEIATDGSGPSSVKTEQAETTVQANTDCINILGTGGTRADDVLEFTAGAGNQTDLGIKTDSVNTGKVITHNGTQWTRDYVRLVDI
jgi:hypothetical protein